MNFIVANHLLGHCEDSDHEDQDGRAKSGLDRETVCHEGWENIVLSRKTGALKLVAAHAGSEPTVQNSSLAKATRIPLSALRARLDPGSSQASWSVGADGVPGRSLVQMAGSIVTFPLGLDHPVEFSSRVRLLPHDWRDGVGAVGAWITVSDSDGSQRRLWSGVLPARTAFGRGPGGLPVVCELPASTVALQLGVEPGTPVPGPRVARAMWVEPAIADPGGPAAMSPVPSTRSPRLAQAQSGRPLISILTPVHDPPLHMLEEAIASVQAQTFADWELCLIDDGSRDPEIIAALERYAGSDPKIHLKRHDTAGGISAATNSGLQLARGEYIALLDHDDTLVPEALQSVGERIAAEPDLDMIYSDEDIVMDGRAIWLHLKPGWSPDTLHTNGYTCHLGVYRHALVSEIGGFRSAFDGSQDVDMILRLVERTDRIAHIPHVLYHWRVHTGSTAGGDAKPYAYVAARNAIAGHLQRCGIDAEVGFGPPGLYRVAHRVDPRQSIALVLAVTGANGLAEAAASWVAQPHAAWSIVLAAPGHVLSACATALRAAGVDDERLTTVPADLDVDPTTALATAALHAEADHLLLMQTPAAGLTYDWLTRLLGYSQQAQIAAAGPILLAPDGRISQAGIALPQGIPLHLLHAGRSSMDSFFGYGTSVFNISAVSGILATRRDTYCQLGGLDSHFGELALIEYCLRAGEAGQRVVIVPDARLRATGADPTTNDLPAIWRLHKRWAHSHSSDPFYNPGYRTDRGDFTPAVRT